MRPAPSPLNKVAVPIRHDEQPVPDQPVPQAIHRLAEVKLKSPYEDAIPGFLRDSKIRITGEAIFDDCIFQSVLFTHFFEKLEAGELKPGQREHDQPAQYLLNKSVELLQPLSVKIEATCRQYDKMLSNSPPELRAKLEEELQFVRGMAARFKTLESGLLRALAQPQDFSPTRDKACFLLFAHAMLSDAVNEVQRWIDDPAGVPPRAALPQREGKLVLSYMTKNGPRSNLFSSEPLTPADDALYEKCLSGSLAIEHMEKTLVPSFSKMGLQGVLAILHCIFHGNGLLTGATREVYVAHQATIGYLSSLRHDCGHVELMIKREVFSHIAPKLLPIYLELENPKSNLADQDVKRDLVVLFYMLHENTYLLATLDPELPAIYDHFRSQGKSFLDCARAHFSLGALNVVDTIPLLNKIGFSLAPFDEQSSPEEKAACYEAVAQAMDSLWKEFRGRHRETLEASGLFSELPKFLAD